MTFSWLCGAVASAQETAMLAGAGPGEIVEAPGGQAERMQIPPVLASKLLAVDLEGSVRIGGWPVAPGVRRPILVQRHDVYDRTARLVVAEGDKLVDVPRSRLVFLWGSIEGNEGGSVLLTVDPDAGSIEGASESGLGAFRLTPEAAGTHLLTRSAEPGDWACGVGCGEDLASLVPALARTPEPRPISVLHTASVAVETDNELLSLKFANNTTTATNYIAQLFAGMNVMYERDLLIRLLQGFTILRPSTTPDPYAQPPTQVGPDAGRASPQQLDEFSGYWATHFGSVKRAVATMLSGKQPDASTSGYSFVGTLCSTQAAGGAYNFNQVYMSPPSRTAADDVREVGHEIGHNFGTRHTHCLPHTPFADLCWSGEGTGCYGDPNITPAPFPTSCPAPQTYSGIANVRGTVMSWCDRPHPGDPTWNCPVTNVFHPQTIAILQPRIDTAVGACIFPFNGGVPAPVVSSIDPNIGPLAGGTSVTLTGTGFQTGASVTFTDASASTPLTAVTVVNPTTITGTTGAHAAGAVDVVVQNPDGQMSTLKAAFTYRGNPTVTSISPNGGPASGGTTVTVTGAGFVSPATLTLGGVSATGVTVTSPTTLTGVTGPHAVGIVNVIVGLAAGLSGTLANGYFYMPDLPPIAFFTLPPCRLVDTRNAPGALGGPALSPAQFRAFALSGVCGVPAGAKALSLNVTVVQPTAPGYLTLYPSDGLPPLTSNINYSPGQTRANNAVLLLATDGSGRLTVFNGSGGTTHVILDVNGYFN